MEQIQKETNEFLKQENHKLEESENLIKKLDQLEQQQNDKQNKAQILYLKTQIYFLHQENLKKAEDSISKALKLNQNESLFWNLMSEIYFKKKNYLGCKNCLEGAIQRDPKNPKYYRELSIIYRLIGEGEERKVNVEQSVEIAKQALNLDLKDGESWYILANAYFTNFFTNQKTIQEILISLKSYKQAKKLLKDVNPDLHYNLGSVYQYLQDYQNAIDEFKIAEQNNLQIETCKEKIIYLNEVIFKQISSNCNLNKKRIQSLIKTIPIQYSSKNGNQNFLPLSQLNFGQNPGKIVACKITYILQNTDNVPILFIMLDSKMNFTLLSIYNAGQQIFNQIKQYSDIQIISPLLKKINLKTQEQNISYDCIQVFDINNIIVDQKKILDVFAPNFIENKTQ